MPLSEEAKKEIATAIGIVREDRFEKYARTTIGGLKPKEEKSEDKPSGDGLEVDDKEKVPAPPEKEGEKEVEKNATKRVDRWWGEIED